MENFKIRTVLENYITAVFGKLYTPSQKERILHLITVANGLETKQVNKVREVFAELEEEELYDFATCNNYLLYSIFSNDESPIKREAISILYDMTKPKPQDQQKPIYYNERIWINAMIKNRDYLEMGYYKYAKGKLIESIEAFEKASRNGVSVPIDEYMAIISVEAEDYQRAYEYALKAQYIDDEKIEVDWLMEIEELAESKISETEASRIRKRVTNSNESPKIGFSNM